MDDALRGYDAWATGMRRSDHAGRGRDPAGRVGTTSTQIIKINPIAAFTDDMIDACIEKYQIMHNPLRELGYRSIGCSPCTRPVARGRGRARRPLAGPHQDRVRAAHVSTPTYPLFLDLTGSRSLVVGGGPCRGTPDPARSSRPAPW